MAKDDKEVIETVQTNEVEKTKVKSATPWMVAFIVLLVLAIMTTCGLLFGYMRRNTVINEIRNGNISMVRGGMMRQRTVFINNTTSTSDTVFAEGVVTSVGTDSFVIGGNGTSTTIKTSGSTTWNTTDKKVAVNDTVIATGTKSDTTVTATDVRIVNQ